MLSGLQQDASTEPLRDLRSAQALRVEDCFGRMPP
jgi:hypothetical protein